MIARRAEAIELWIWVHARNPQRFRLRLAALVVLGANMAGALMMAIDPKLALAFLAGLIGGAILVERPLWAIGVLIAGRLTSTGATAWVTIGRIHVDLFELALVIAGVAVLAAAIRERYWRFDMRMITWRIPVVGLLCLQSASVLWCLDRGEWAGEVLSTVVLLATTLAITVFIRTWEQARNLLSVWVLVCLSVAILAAAGFGVASEDAAHEMSQTGRQGGFGQHPNWYSMNLMYAPLTALALGASASTKGRARLWWFAGFTVAVAQMQSGSRGGTYALFIGVVAMSILHPALRRKAMQGVVAVAAAATATIVLIGGTLGNVTARIFEVQVIMSRGIRLGNWKSCIGMLFDTYGRGIGAGGYDPALERVNPVLADSQYSYPHGIFWEVIAHYGVIGLWLGLLFGYRVIKMGVDALRLSLHLPQSTMIAAMLATMMGYGAWSFWEFTIADKPFWEYLAIYTAVCLSVLEGRDEKTEGDDEPDTDEAVSPRTPTPAEPPAPPPTGSATPTPSE